MRGFDVFDRVYVVHLPDVERGKHITDELERVGIGFKFVSVEAPHKAFTVPNMRRNPRAEFGAGLGHIAAVVQAIADRAERPLFLEDDVIFRVKTCPLPDKWDVLYLGGHPRGPAQIVSPGIAKIGKFSCAEAYSIWGSRLVEFHDYWCSRITKPDAMYDFILGEFAWLHDHESYATYPVVTEQAPFVSHIKGEVDDKRALVERGWRSNLSIK